MNELRSTIIVPTKETGLSDEVICPYCGHEHTDSWEWNSGEEGQFEANCDACGKEIIIVRYMSIDYKASTLETKEIYVDTGEDVPKMEGVTP